MNKCIVRDIVMVLVTVVVLGCDQTADVAMPVTIKEPPHAGITAVGGVKQAPAAEPFFAKTEALPLANLTQAEPTPDDDVHILELADGSGRSAFSAFGPGHNVAFTSSGMTVTYLNATTPSDPNAELDHHLRNETISVRFHGADPDVQGEGLAPFATTTNILSGDSFTIAAEAYAGIRFPNAYPGIDLYYLDNGSQFSFVFVVQPGADSNQIRFSVTGGDESYIDAHGTLITTKTNGTFEISKPISFQSMATGDAMVDSAFEVSLDESAGLNLVESESVAINVGSYSPTDPLIIDPTITFVTLLGNSQNTLLSVEPVSGDVYVAGPSANHTNGVFYVARHDGSNGSRLNQTLIFAGSRDTLRDIFVSGDDLYITGDTRVALLSAFTSNPPPLQPQLAGNTDAFVIRMDRESLVPDYGTYIGGSARESGAAIKADRSGNIYLAGHTDSDNFPLVEGPATSDGFDSFVIKFKPSVGGTSDIVYAKLTGGSTLDNTTDADIDEAGNLYIVGRTNSPDFPLVNPMPVEFAPATVGYNPFLAKFDPMGALVFSSYAHKNDVESGVFALGMDASESGDVIGFGGTVFDSNLQTRGYIMKVARDPNSQTYQMVYTHKPLGNGTVVQDVVLDSDNNLYGVGESSSELPVTSPTEGLSGTSAFLYVLYDYGGTESLLYSKSFGGTGIDRATGIDIDRSTNSMTIVGSTTSNPFTGLDDSDLPSNSSRGFLLKFDAVVAPPPPNTAPLANLAPLADVELRQVAFRVTPDTFNKKSNGRWVKGHLSLVENAFATVYLDATASIDADGDDLSYTIELKQEEGTTTFTEPNVSVDLSPGSYKVKVTVCDTAEACASTDATFTISQINLEALTAEDFTLNGVAADRVNWEENELVISFSRDLFGETVEVGESVPVVLDGAISAIDHIKVIHPGPDDGEDGDEDGNRNWWDFLKGLLQRVWNALEKIWEYFTS